MVSHGARSACLHLHLLIGKGKRLGLFREETQAGCSEENRFRRRDRETDKQASVEV